MSIAGKQRFLVHGNGKTCTALSYKHRHMQTLITENHTCTLWSQISSAHLTLISSVKQCSPALPAITERHFGLPVTLRPYSCEVNQVTQKVNQSLLLEDRFVFMALLLQAAVFLKRQQNASLLFTIVPSMQCFRTVFLVQFSVMIACIV